MKTGMFGLAAALLFEAASAQNREIVWLVPPASSTSQQGFVRVTNNGPTPSDVTIFGVDDSGFRSPGTASITLAPQETRALNSSDLEQGNPSKGVAGSLGRGTGNWRIYFDSAGPISAGALIRTPDGFLTNVHDTSSEARQVSRAHYLSTVNPSENVNQLSVLRLVNPGSTGVTVQLFGNDDLGVRYPASSLATFSLPAFSAVQLTSLDLERGNPEVGLSNGIGNGSGKWRITIYASAEIKVMNLLFDPKGYLTELASEALDGRDFGYFYCADFAGAMIFSQDGGGGQIVLEDDTPVYLGYFGNTTDRNSVNNPFGPFGSVTSATSVRNPDSKYGSDRSYVSWRTVNAYTSTSTAPVIVKNGEVVAILSRDTSKRRAISLDAIDTCDFSGVTRRADW